MSRQLTAFLPVDSPGALSQLAADPQWWLPAPATAVPGGWVVPMHAGSLTRSVLCRVGAPVQETHRLWRPISWEPSDAGGRARPVDRLLPTFTGDLGVVLGPAATLVLTGTYDPPGAALGSIVDRAGLERVADRTARRFLVDIARQLTALQSTGAPRR